MALVPLSPTTHRDCFWLGPSDWQFARGRAIWPISAGEMPELATEFVLAWIKQAGQYQLIALLGLKPDFNLFVARDGKWLPKVMPTTLRCAPFVNALSENNQQVLCLDDQAGQLLNAEDVHGDQESHKAYSLFNRDGQLSESLEPVAKMLLAHHQNLNNTYQAIDALEEAGLIVPWPATFATESQGKVKLEGLYGLDESALNQCDAVTLKHLQGSGALAMAYCQLISQQHLGYLGKLADAHLKLEHKQAKDLAYKLDLEQFFGDDDSFKI